MKFWLFEKEADVLWQQKKLRWYAAWRLIALVGVSVCWGLALLLLAEGNYPVQYLLTYVNTPLVALLNVLPVVVLSLLFYAAFARALPAFLASGFVTFGFSAANYYLLRFRDDPLMALDLLDFSTAVHFTDEYSLAPDKRLWTLIGCFVLALLMNMRFQQQKSELGREGATPAVIPVEATEAPVGTPAAPAVENLENLVTPAPAEQPAPAPQN